MNRVRIFISSPGDVAPERACTLEVVNALQAEEEFAETLRLEALLWEQEPLLATSDFQSQIKSPAEFDIFVTIIGSRLGSRLGKRFTRRDGTEYKSGTEYEFEVAVEAYHAKGHPELLVYRKKLPDASVAEVDEFFDKWFLDAEERTSIGAYHTFVDQGQYEKLVTLHLRKLLRRFLPRPNNLPEPISSFVGRRELVRDVQSTLLASDVRLLTLVGPGGSGKSRLALRVARGVLPEFDDGVFFVPVAALRQADLVPAAIATTLDIKQGSGDSVLESVTGALQGKQLLLVIDNLEQVQAAAKQIGMILAACPGVKALVTSRESLRIAGARSVQVPPLTLPPRATRSFRSIRDAESVQLFVERAQTVRSDFALTEENAEAVLEICHRLDGLPLAIELATSRLRSMDIDRLLRAMEKRFAVLKGGAEDLLDHQRSLRELIAWSYDLLTDEEQTLWRRMAVFLGGFTMEAGEEVCDPDDEFVVDIEVESLADKSLATIVFGEGETRVNLLGTLREFALEKLREVGEYDRFQGRFLAWVEELARDSGEVLKGTGAQDELARLDRERTNIDAAVDYGLSLGESGLKQVLNIASGVWRYWYERGQISRAREILEHAREDVAGLDPEIRVIALKGLGSMARFQNDLDAAQTACELALEICGDDHPGARANVLTELGAIFERKGELDRAEAYLDEALALFEGLGGDAHGWAMAASAKGVIDHLQGELDTARGFYDTALTIGAEAGDSDSIASALVNLGELDAADGNVDGAYDCYKRSLRYFYDRGNVVAIAYCAEVIAGLEINHRAASTEAAMYFGFADAQRKLASAPVEPFNEQRIQDDVKATRDALAEEPFASSWDAGASMEVDDFIALVENR